MNLFIYDCNLIGNNLIGINYKKYFSICKDDFTFPMNLLTSKT